MSAIQQRARPPRFDRVRLINGITRFAAASLIGLVGCGARAAPVIDIVVSEPTGIYQEAADGLSRALAGENWTLALSSPERLGIANPDLRVAIGTRALEAALAQPARPVLSLLVPRLTFERLAAGKEQVTALYLDQPIPRQLRLLELALPGLNRVGAPLGPASQAMQPSLQNAAKETGIEVASAQIRRAAELHPSLDALATDSQAFLLLPDPLVAQRNMLQNFFLHTYRLRKPVLAYSAPLAQSGALLALYATPSQLGEEAAGWILESRSSGFRLGAPRHPKRFTIAVNRTVARSLQIALPSEAVLTRELEARR